MEDVSCIGRGTLTQTELLGNLESHLILAVDIKTPDRSSGVGGENCRENLGNQSVLSFFSINSRIFS